MGNKKKYGLFVAVVCCFMSVTQIAKALPDCTVWPNDIGYDAGYWGGWSMVSQAWLGIGEDCDKIKYNNDFQDPILAALAMVAALPKPNDYLKCRYQGYNQGANDKLQALVIECLEPCVFTGEAIGEWATLMWCELSISYGQCLPATPNPLVDNPLTPCDVAQSEACEDYFTDNTPTYTTSTPPSYSCAPYAPDPATDPLVFDPPDPVCQAGWEQAQNDQCVSNPIPPTP
jgi:hypothetical protein